MTFRFDRVVNAVGDYSAFDVDGDDGIADASTLPSTDVKIVFTSLKAAGLAYDVEGFAGLVFAGGGTPAYPLTGLTT